MPEDTINGFKCSRPYSGVEIERLRKQANEEQRRSPKKFAKKAQRLQEQGPTFVNYEHPAPFELCERYGAKLNTCFPLKSLLKDFSPYIAEYLQRFEELWGRDDSSIQTEIFEQAQCAVLSGALRVAAAQEPYPVTPMAVLEWMDRQYTLTSQLSDFFQQAKALNAERQPKAKKSEPAAIEPVSKQGPLSSNEKAILACIQEHPNGIMGKSIASETGIDEDTARHTIQKLRFKGYPVLNQPRHGYKF